MTGVVENVGDLVTSAQVGQSVAFGFQSGVKVVQEGSEYRVITEDDILMIL
jgi:co-chaperonin GroES (HSP10)